MVNRNEVLVENIGKEKSGDTEYEKCVDELCTDFPKGGFEGILPPHFLKATFPKIGARIVTTRTGNSKFWGLLLPGNSSTDREWIMRSFWVGIWSEDLKKLALSQILKKLKEENFDNVAIFEHSSKMQKVYEGKELARLDNGIVLAEPNNEEAVLAQILQKKVWNITNEAFLYPHDLYHPYSGLATRLIARDEASVVGFLFGFYGRGKQWYGSQSGFHNGQWLESQLMGIDPTYRRKGIGRSLKLLQRESAQQEGLEVIHWTVDPLQAGNAELNMNTLGGVAVQHYRNYYNFRNNLNRVAASRIGISWLVNSDRVEKHSDGYKQEYDFAQISKQSTTEIVHPILQTASGLKKFKVASWKPSSKTILFEIPNDWNTLQESDLTSAELWRESSDDILETILSKDNPLYAITGITRDLMEYKTYLVIQKINQNLGI